MKNQNEQAWEKFCRTGCVTDYLDYRAATDAVCGDSGGMPVTKGANHAAADKRAGDTGKAAGGA
ncbi:MAG: hypothetical protein RR022_05820 [Angelakisella sp.]